MDRFEIIEEAAFAVFGAPISSYERNIVARVYDEVAPKIQDGLERRDEMAELTTDDLCKILHYALSREMRAHGVTDLDLEDGITWDESPAGYKAAIRGAVSSMELVTRKDERMRYRNELNDCMADLAMNPRSGD